MESPKSTTWPTAASFPIKAAIQPSVGPWRTAAILCSPPQPATPSSAAPARPALPSLTNSRRLKVAPMPRNVALMTFSPRMSATTPYHASPNTLRRLPQASSPPEGLQESSFGFASHGDDDFSLSVSLFQIPDGLGDLAQRVGPVDDRCDLAGFYELLEDDHVLVVLLGDERAQLLVHERGQHERAELAIGASEPSSSPFASSDDEDPFGGEGAPEA